MNLADASRAVADSALPARLKAYLIAFVKSGADSNLRRLLKSNPVKLLANLSALLDRSAEILNMDRDKVLFATGFDPRNLAHDRLEADLAELRAACYLFQEAFSDIRLIPAGLGKTADISAVRSGRSFIFEVRCVNSENNLFAVDHIFDPQGGISATSKDAVKFLKKVYEKKICQARANNKKTGGSAITGTIIVIDPAGFVSMADTEELGRLCRELYEELGRPEKECVCLISGPLHAAFPPWGDAVPIKG